MVKLFSSALLLTVLFTGCLGKGPDRPTCDPASYDACGTVAPQSEITAVQNYLTANGIQAVQHCSGMFYKIDVMGNGAAPTVCSTITVNYEGKLTNGTVFDQTTSSPAAFPLANVIRGWKNALPLIKSGGRIYLYVPPTLGYGANANGPIPANSILIFRVDLLGVQ